MFISDLFEYADYSTTAKVTQKKHKISGSEKLYLAIRPAVTENFKIDNKVNENSHLADVITARDLINRAIQNPDSKQEYFDFLKHLRTKHGNEYSTSVHQQAAKLSKGNS